MAGPLRLSVFYREVQGLVKDYSTHCSKKMKCPGAVASAPVAIRKQCSVLEEKIVARRRENPEHGVRRIRDDIRRQEGIEVGAEKVRTVVNDL